MSLSDSLGVLDLSGNVSLGNSGGLQLLRACSSRLCLESQDITTTHLSLVACGIESPLPEEFIKLVKLLLSGEGTIRSHAPFKIDLFGNLIDQADCNLLS